MAGSAQFVRGNLQQGRLVAAVGFVTQTAVLSGRGMHNPGLPIDGDLRMTGQTYFRLLPCQISSQA